MKPRQNLQLDRTKLLFYPGWHPQTCLGVALIAISKRLEQQLADNNLHRPEFLSRMDLKTNLA